ncbi:MAG TPA: TIGR03016 family PEP-CTERM system-associated outer membrane protein [Rubrivivax sp.]|nr:TIGR03016 family PEP-CTERM system-associated outer membrane protein [Rubrivivax sp.]
MKMRPRASAARRPLCGLLALAAAGAAAQGLGGGGVGLGSGGLGMGSDLGLGYGNAGGNLHQGAVGGSRAGSTPESGGRAFYIVPQLAVGTTLTDNVNLSATNKQSDLILEVMPGVHLGGQSGRVRGFLDYTLNASLHARHQESGNLRNYLNAGANAELVPSRLFVDASASVSQQFISPFGTQTPDSSLNNNNRTEVTTVSVAPYTQGQIAGQVNYVGRAFFTHTDSGTSQASNSTVWGGLLGFDSTTRWSRLSWGLDFSYRQARFDDRRNEFDQLNVLSLNYAITPELSVSGRGNVEASNLVTVDDETTTGWGGGVRWNPSPRTRFVAEYDKRAFGNSHLISLDYRTPRTVWALSNRQGLSTGQFNNGRGNSASPFDLLFAQFAQVEPDPVARAQLVNNFMRANGINSSASLNNGYLPNQVVLERRQEGSVSWLGVRDTVIFNVYQTQSEALQPGLLNPDNPFAGGNTLRWRGAQASWSHRLTPLDNLSANARWQRTTETFGGQETTLWAALATWSTQLGARTKLSLSARYTTQSGSSSYDEAALLAMLNMSF